MYLFQNNNHDYSASSRSTDSVFDNSISSRFEQYGYNTSDKTNSSNDNNKRVSSMTQNHNFQNQTQQQVSRLANNVSESGGQSLGNEGYNFKGDNQYFNSQNSSTSNVSMYNNDFATPRRPQLDSTSSMYDSFMSEAGKRSRIESELEPYSPGLASTPMPGSKSRTIGSISGAGGDGILGSFYDYQKTRDSSSDQLSPDMNDNAFVSQLLFLNILL